MEECVFFAGWETHHIAQSNGPKRGAKASEVEGDGAVLIFRCPVGLWGAASPPRPDPLRTPGQHALSKRGPGIDFEGGEKVGRMKGGRENERGTFCAACLGARGRFGWGLLSGFMFLAVRGRVRKEDGGGKRRNEEGGRKSGRAVSDMMMMMVFCTVR